jgi:hypothetical protein
MRRTRPQILALTLVAVGLALLFTAVQLSPTVKSAWTQEQSRVLAHPEVKSLPSKEKRWALIVGIDEYKNDVSSLKGAVNDARALKDVLVKYAGFPANQIVLLTTDAVDPDQLPTRANILDELDSFTHKVPADGLLLFSFGGHGVSIDNEAYLVPSDGRITKNLRLLRDFSVDVQRIKEAIKEIKVDQVVMLLDACRNQPGKGEVANELAEAYKRGFSFDVANSEVKAFATLYATSIGSRAFEFYDKDTRRFRGYFSYAIEEGMKGKAANAHGQITLSNLITYIENAVPKRVKFDKGEVQVPSTEIVGYKDSELVLAIGGSKASEPAPIMGATGNTSPADEFPARPDYDSLTDQATAEIATSLKNSDVNTANLALKTLQQALVLDPSRPTAHQLLGYLQLYGFHNMVLAEQSMRAAVERGGSAVFFVAHDDGGVFSSSCQGSLFISKSSVSYKPSNSGHAFETDKSKIEEASLNSVVGANFGAFHLKVKLNEGGKEKSKTLNFAPATQSKAESNLVISLIRSY